MADIIFLIFRRCHKKIDKKTEDCNHSGDKEEYRTSSLISTLYIEIRMMYLQLLGEELKRSVY